MIALFINPLYDMIWLWNFNATRRELGNRRMCQQVLSRDELMMVLNFSQKKEREARESNVYWREKLVLYYKTGLNRAELGRYEVV